MTSDRDRDDDHLEELRDALVQISFALMAVLTEVAAEHNLSLTQLRMLGILRDREPTMADLATLPAWSARRSAVSSTARHSVVWSPRPPTLTTVGRYE